MRIEKLKFYWFYNSLNKKKCLGQSGPRLKFLRFSSNDCVGYELIRLMSGVSSSVRHRYVSSKREQYCTPTASLSARFARQNWVYGYQKFDDFFQVVNKILVFQRNRLFL